MNLKNYTSTVPVDRTIARIEQALAKAGACSISKEYAPGGMLAALTFDIDGPQQRFTIRLPADAEKVYQAMAKGVPNPRNGTLQRLREQSSRTAWKIMQDWVEVQLSLIQLEQAKPLEVFMPYIWDRNTRQTLFQHFDGNNFRNLLTDSPLP